MVTTEYVRAHGDQFNLNCACNDIAFACRRALIDLVCARACRCRVQSKACNSSVFTANYATVIYHSNRFWRRSGSISMMASFRLRSGQRREALLVL